MCNCKLMFVVALLSVVLVTSASSLNIGKGALINRTEEMLGIQNKIIAWAALMDEQNSTLRSLINKREEMRAQIQTIKHSNRSSLVDMMKKHVDWMIYQHRIVESVLKLDIGQNYLNVSKSKDCKSNIPNNPWFNYEKCWNIYLQFTANVLKLNEIICDVDGSNMEEERDHNSASPVSPDELPTIMATSVSTLAIFIALSLTLYFILRARYHIVKRSSRHEGVSPKSTEPSAELPGVRDASSGSHNKDKRPSTKKVSFKNVVSVESGQQNTEEDEECPLYEELDIKEAPKTSGKDMSDLQCNTLSNIDQTTDEEGNYCVLHKPCSSKVSYTHTTVIPVDRNTVIPADENTCEYDTISKAKPGGALGSADKKGRYSTLGTTRLDLTRPSKEGPETQYSCNVDLNQTLSQRLDQKSLTALLRKCEVRSSEDNEEEEPIYDEIYPKTPPKILADERNLRNTLADKDQALEEEEIKNSDLDKPCSTKKVETDIPREEERPLDIVTLQAKQESTKTSGGDKDDSTSEERCSTSEERCSTSEERCSTSEERCSTSEERCSTSEERCSTSEERCSTSEERCTTSEERCSTSEERCSTSEERCTTSEERCSTSGQDKLDFSEKVVTEKSDKNRIVPKDRRGEMSLIKSDTLPKEGSSIYSCTLDLNQTLMNQPVRNMMTTLLLETDTGLDCETTDDDRDALVEEEDAGDKLKEN